MNTEQFELVKEDILSKLNKVLSTKNREYTGEHDDRLSNFKKASCILNSTPEQALWGFLVKHLVSIGEIVNQYIHIDTPDAFIKLIEEKTIDVMAYMILLNAIYREKLFTKGGTL